jgi:hypothetical protein
VPDGQFCHLSHMGSRKALCIGSRARSTRLCSV